ncbi:hypothetical protein MLD38_018824 [Melastoma candidum]|uniref:Uncharacterized protein n=2 Tax=Melastoma candidum TaxID=119954 RepID=A0ACB9QWB9_9MYRT|nr:hypothetical protein MLD38_018824 [Melastoma candidum]
MATIIQPKDDKDGVTNECKKLLSSLPKERGWRTEHIYLFQGYWCQPKQIQAILSFQSHFHALDSDLVLATIPKSGTTWLKALAFAIVNRHRFPISKSDHPLLFSNPHDLVPFFEYNVYMGNEDPAGYLSGLPSPRIFCTHIPYSAMADSIKSSRCKVVYICRNPLDTFVSSWIYTDKIRSDGVPPLPFEEAFDMFCEGKIGYGPFWDHVLGYWNESRERPDKVLFLRYEDMKADVVSHLKKLALHLGYPFSEDEEERGEVERLAELCSFEKMKELEVNKSGKSIMNFENQKLFRKARVGDWVNYLSPSMEERLRKEIEARFQGSGLSF